MAHACTYKAMYEDVCDHVFTVHVKVSIMCGCAVLNPNPYAVCNNIFLLVL